MKYSKVKLFLILQTMLFILFSCDNAKQEITRNEIIGTYEQISKTDDPRWNNIKNTIVLSNDSTFEHIVLKNDSLLIQEYGNWKYRTDFNINIITLDYYTNFIQYQTKTMITGESSFQVKKTMFGKIYLPVNIPYDPDGAPITPKYKKIK